MYLYICMYVPSYMCAYIQARAAEPSAPSELIERLLARGMGTGYMGGAAAPASGVYMGTGYMVHGTWV